MRAVQVVRLDGPAAVEVREVPEPERGPDQVLVDVRAAGVNFPDVLQSKGLYQYRPDPPFTLGSEAAGVVREAPDGSSLRARRPGGRVRGRGRVRRGRRGGRRARPAPARTRSSFAAGAGLPMNYLTAHFALARARAPARRGRPCWCTARPAASARPTIQLAAALGRAGDRGGVHRGQGGGREGRGRPRRRARRGLQDAVKELTGGAGRRRGGRPGRRRPLHRLAAQPRPGGPAAGDRVHRRATSPRSGSTGCCSTTSTSSASAGAAFATAPARLPRAASGRSWSRTCARARSTR